MTEAVTVCNKGAWSLHAHARSPACTHARAHAHARAHTRTRTHARTPPLSQPYRVGLRVAGGGARLSRGGVACLHRGADDRDGRRHAWCACSVALSTHAGGAALRPGLTALQPGVVAGGAPPVWRPLGCKVGGASQPVARPGGHTEPCRGERAADFRLSTSHRARAEARSAVARLKAGDLVLESRHGRVAGACVREAFAEVLLDGVCGGRWQALWSWVQAGFGWLGRV